MKNKQTIVLLFIFISFIIYFYYFSPKSLIQNNISKKNNFNKDFIISYKKIFNKLSKVDKKFYIHDAKIITFGILKDLFKNNEKEIIIENKLIKVVLSSKGGLIKKVILKKYKTYDKKPLVLLDSNSSEMGLKILFRHNNSHLYTNQLLFKTEAIKNPDTNLVNKVIFTLNIDKNSYIQQIFFLPKDGYSLKYKIKFFDTNHYINEDKIQFFWYNMIKRVEKNLEESRNKTTINYCVLGEKFDHLNERSDKKKEEINIQKPLKWIAIKQKFFTSGIVSKESFKGCNLSLFSNNIDNNVVKLAVIKLNLSVLELMQKKGEFSFYFGPNIYEELNIIASEFSSNIFLGWPVIESINKFFIIPIFKFLDKNIHNYGIVIILLVIIIKFFLIPLSYKSYISMAKIRILKPELDKIKLKHKDNIHKIQIDQINLYRKMGISPLSGCIPVILQMPILLAMFNLLPNLIELRQESFLWADDLSTYDSIYNLSFNIPLYGDHISLFTFLMTLATILYSLSNNQMSTAQGPMKNLVYIMPIGFMFILNSFPAGLTFYYFISNLFTFVQQIIIRKFVDEDKIKEKFKENELKNKNKRKTKFQLHLEGAMKIIKNKKSLKK